MEMTGRRDVPAAPDTVWRALNDPMVLKECIAGCESIEANGENQYTMVLAAKVGPVAARFAGKMRLADVEPPRSYTLHFEGSGGVAGFARGEGRVTLVPRGGDATTLEYVAKAQVGGKLAQVGSRLIDGVAQKMTEDFFERFAASVSPSPPLASSAIVADVAVVPAPRRPRRIVHAVIAYAVIAAAVILLAVALLWRRAA